MSEDIVRVVRVIEYEGPREWVERTLGNSIHGTMRLSTKARITGVVLDECALELPKDIQAALEKARGEELVNG